jgi:integrase
MTKPHTGSIRERKTKRGVVYYARLDYTDEAGNRKAITRRCPTKSEATRAKGELVREYEERIARGGPAKPEAIRFAEYADEYSDTYLVAPTYEGDRKTAGLRGWKLCRNSVKRLKAQFGHRLLSTIRYSDLARFKQQLLATETRRKKPRKIATVNRELIMLHTMLVVAVRDGRIKANPFDAGPPLIDHASETQRTRTLIGDEEQRLMDACLKIGKPELQPIIWFALDTGARRGQIIGDDGLKWSDVDFDAGLVWLRTYKGKNVKRYPAAMTRRVREILDALHAQSGGDPDAIVFRCTSYQHVWQKVKKEAGLKDFTFHDLRHSTATRLVRRNVPLEHVARLLGHSDIKMTFRYVTATPEDLKNLAAKLDEEAEGEAGETVN